MDIIFNEKDHTYYYNNKLLISVTQLIKKYTKEFDEDYYALELSKKTGYEIEDIKLSWKKIREDASHLGSNIHYYLLYLLTDNIKYKEPENKIEENYFRVSRKLAKYILNKYNVLGTEKIIFSEDLKIAGTVDLVLSEKETNEIVIADFKSGKPIINRNKFNKLLYPLNHLDDCSYNKYSLQLNIYKYIFLYEGLYDSISDRLWIIHLTQNNFIFYPSLDLQKEVSMILI